MQVRFFIKPDQVALMFSAGDWLSDRMRVCLHSAACTLFAFHDR